MNLPQQMSAPVPTWIAQLSAEPAATAVAVPEAPFTVDGGVAWPSESRPQQTTTPVPAWMAHACPPAGRDRGGGAGATVRRREEARRPPSRRPRRFPLGSRTRPSDGRCGTVAPVDGGRGPDPRRRPIWTTRPAPGRRRPSRGRHSPATASKLDLSPRTHASVLPWCSARLRAASGVAAGQRTARALRDPNALDQEVTSSRDHGAAACHIAT